ncbi:MAG: peptidylprolyl isomerase [Bacillota bacterium]|nr:peptidylprolyl isomerase [Bacillota bacterium]
MLAVLIITGFLILTVIIVVPYSVRKYSENNNKNKKIVSSPVKKEVVLQAEQCVYISMTTTKGEMILELRKDLMPVTVNNFLRLVSKKFYNGLLFHRVEPWLIQSGDPTGTGKGGSERTIPLEISRELKNKKYSIGMARLKDPNSASSQFYILKHYVKSLDGQFAVFGTVKKGQDVVLKIEKTDKIIDIKEL